MVCFTSYIAIKLFQKLLLGISFLQSLIFGFPITGVPSFGPFSLIR